MSYLLLYDDFTEFQSQCTFLCDAVVALAMSELLMDKWSVNGLHMNAVQVKQRAQVFGEKLQVLRTYLRSLYECDRNMDHKVQTSQSE